jgi:hypothetical protein
MPAAPARKRSASSQRSGAVGSSRFAAGSVQYGAAGSGVFIVEDGGLHIGSANVLAAGARGGEQGAGGQVIEAAHDAAGILEEQIDGAGAKEHCARTDGPGPTIQKLAALAIGERASVARTARRRHRASKSGCRRRSRKRGWPARNNTKGGRRSKSSWPRRRSSSNDASGSRCASSGISGSVVGELASSASKAAAVWAVVRRTGVP